MLIEGRDSSSERRILIAALTDPSFLTRIVSLKEPFRSKYANLLFSWCKAYYLEYQAAPRQAIQALYEQWAAKTNDKDLARLVESFLLSLSNEYEREVDPTQGGFLLDLAQEHFNGVLLERHKETLRSLLDRNQVSEALEEQAKFKPIKLRPISTINVLYDLEAQRLALEESPKSLIKWRGAADSFFGNELSVDAFIGVMAVSKGGKSFTLLDFAWRLMLQGLGVGYFQIGDMTKNQIMRRFHRRASYRPLWAGDYLYPTGIVLSEGDYRRLAIVERTTKTYAQPVIWEQGQQAFARIASRCKGRLELSCHATKSASVSTIKGVLSEWAEIGFVPKALVIDYAGNLAFNDPKGNVAQQTDYNWALLRQLSEELNILVITAQQTNKEGFKAWVLTRNNFRDSLMILAHVTAFLGVNATDEEKRNGVLRYNWVVARDSDFSETQCLYAGRSYEIANPLVVTCLDD